MLLLAPERFSLLVLELAQVLLPFQELLLASPLELLLVWLLALPAWRLLSLLAWLLA
ncbi:hypothetical protein [Massilia soli]|uniref:Uncharacterized protein n=1 Tax=Massilia soli TaxID=2792854 RepID=A0ABS7SNK2_9BURK|nr:hypothetical protein [Massilia soli]MBZ2207759.1 hypothetical protein [Massilia soli]